MTNDEMVTHLKALLDDVALLRKENDRMRAQMKALVEGMHVLDGRTRKASR